MAIEVLVHTHSRKLGTDTLCRYEYRYRYRYGIGIQNRYDPRSSYMLARKQQGAARRQVHLGIMYTSKLCLYSFQLTALLRTGSVGAKLN